jgi:hypothetical protein
LKSFCSTLAAAAAALASRTLLPAPSLVTAGLVDGGVAATLGDSVDPPLSCRARPPGERVLQRALQGHELRDVHRGDREEDHEQRHQQRDHVRVGEQPALVALLRLFDGAHAPAA